jgi:hypothetical protein
MRPKATESLLLVGRLIPSYEHLFTPVPETAYSLSSAGKILSCFWVRFPTICCTTEVSSQYCKTSLCLASWRHRIRILVSGRLLWLCRLGLGRGICNGQSVTGTSLLQILRFPCQVLFHQLLHILCRPAIDHI